MRNRSKGRLRVSESPLDRSTCTCVHRNWACARRDRESYREGLPGSRIVRARRRAAAARARNEGLITPFKFVVARGQAGWPPVLVPVLVLGWQRGVETQRGVREARDCWLRFRSSPAEVHV